MMRRRREHVRLMLLLIVFLVGYSAAQLDGRKAGPFYVSVDLLEECPNIGNGKIRFTAKTRRRTRSVTTIDSNITLLCPLDDSFDITVNTAQFTNGGWKENYFEKKFNKLCTAAESYFGSVIKAIHDAANLPKGKPKCPLPTRTYYVKNFVVDIKMDYFPFFFYNKYRTDLVFEKKSVRHGCLRVFSELRPKNSKS